MSTAIAWFEIPTRDIERAQRFYEALLGVSLKREDFGPHTLAVFPYAEPGVGGCLIAGRDVAAPSREGTLVYLDAGASLDAALARLERAGGTLVTPPVQLPGEMGRYAHVADPDGNRVGLHAPR
jgi:predicted enzyme related to lactoylglutathione lyase